SKVLLEPAMTCEPTFCKHQFLARSGTRSKSSYEDHWHEVGRVIPSAEDSGLRQTSWHSNRICPSTANPAPARRPESAACETRPRCRGSPAGCDTALDTANSHTPNVETSGPHP